MSTEGDNLMLSDTIKNILACDPPDNVRSPRVRKSNSIDLRFNENPYGASPLAIKAIKDSLSNPYCMSQYPDMSSPLLRQKLSSVLGVESNQIIVGNGSSEVINFVFSIFGGPGHNAVLERNGFPGHIHAAKATGTDIRFANNPHFMSSTDNIISSINEKTALVVLSNPGNPSGRVFNLELVRNFISKIPSRVFILLDEAYFEYANYNNYAGGVELLETFENIIITRTFSKAYGLAGLRCGYGIAHKNVIFMLNQVRSRMNVNIIAQMASLAAIDDQDHLNLTLKNNSIEMNKINRRLSLHGISGVGLDGNFLLFPVNPKNSISFSSFLKEHKFLVKSAFAFGEDDEYIRMSIGLPEHTEIFCTLLDQYME